MIAVVLLLLVVTFVVYLLHFISSKNAQYFSDQNLKYKGFAFNLSIFYSTLFGKIDVFELTQRYYDGAPGEP